MSTSPSGASSPHEPERLLFRRQFLLGTADIEGFPTWNRRTIAASYRLCAHPDLSMTHVDRGCQSMTLLGYMLDPDDPTATDAKIVEGLSRDWKTTADLPRLTSRLGGRWAIVAHDGARTVLIHDAAGLRQAYYYTSTAAGRPSLICASQPGLIAETCHLSPDPNALAYIKSRGEDDGDVYWMPGDTSPYENVRALLPNHLLSLEEGKAVRYGPIGHARTVPSAEALREVVATLGGLLESARLRQPLALAMTAGWDSRLMLALCREVARDVYCYTLTYPTSSNARDVEIPARLLGKLGLTHHVLRYPEVVDESFKAIARRSNSAVHGAYCADAQAVYEQYPSGRLCITGDVAEVVKAHCRLRRTPAKAITAADLASVCKVGSHPFALAAFDSWLSGVAGYEHMDVLDLFCWEQIAGRWHAQIRAEFDIAQESFAPLNCRSLLLTMLAVEEGYRAGPRFALLREMIELLWRDLLLVPINPRERLRWRRAAVSALRRLHVYQWISPETKSLAKRALSGWG